MKIFEDVQKLIDKIKMKFLFLVILIAVFFNTYSFSQIYIEKEETSFYVLPKIKKHLKKSWLSSNLGMDKVECGFVILQDDRIVDLEKSFGDVLNIPFNTSNKPKAIFHTHRNTMNGKPSSTDVMLAKTLKIDIYVLHNTGLYKVGSNGIIIKLEKNLNWLK